MKVSARDADARVRTPDPAIKAYLIYGPDRGLAHERAGTLVKSILPDPDDPFALTLLTEEDLKSDPAALADAMVAMSLTGGQRLVRVRLSGETGGGPVADVISEIESGSLAPQTVLVVESGDLTPRGKLRKAFEPAKKALSIACYADDARSLGNLAEDLLKDEGLSIASDARMLWLPRLEGDRALARGEIDKLILYKGLRGQRAEGDDTVTLEDVEAIAADQGEAQMDAVIEPALLGRLAEADKAYVRSVSAGGSPVAILRALQRRLDQIGVVQGSGGDDAALARSGAPRFGPQADAFKRQVSLWRGRRLDHARQLAFQAERDVKRSGSPAEALVSELLIRLARGAAQASR
ncbi:DNA polymerase III subunit delta [Maricaulis virginensis]|uniref:DNA-directed DNA polymerase n=1 Tax=Maricaulis virginensis TaxID=144022 RepID=A0A9W6IPC6_9PROT|nr:DNA polymerase III subunit delta [Maricaulis virginensis]GLK52869.1 DNA polymerase III subunit delta [Maricaulis virginensis]